jgi:hypothetical protein
MKYEELRSMKGRRKLSLCIVSGIDMCGIFNDKGHPGKAHENRNTEWLVRLESGRTKCPEEMLERDIRPYCEGLQERKETLQNENH